MKKVIMFSQKNCPHCINALNIIKNLREENAAYLDINIQVIDEREQKELADSYDYYYVPTFYVENVKMHEGSVSVSAIKKVLDSAL